ncbi:MAG: amidohydrolase, partial [Gammaproteobacteria bacterium]
MRTLAFLLILIVPHMASGAERIAVINGRVHTATSAGTLDGATVLIEDGVIRRVVRNLPLPPGVRVIDATGKHVTPGIFAAWSELGLNEVSQVPGTVDTRVTDVELGPAFRVDAAVNPETSLIPVARLEGVTRALIVPRP